MSTTPPPNPAAEAAASAGTSTRVLTALAFGIPVVALVWWGPTWAVTLVVAAVVYLSLREFFALAEKLKLGGHPIWVMICSAWILTTRWRVAVEGFARSENVWWSPTGLTLPLDYLLFAFAMGIAVLTTIRAESFGEALPSACVSAAAILFITMPLSFLIPLHAFYDHGAILLVILAMVWVGDSAAYFVGRAVGKHKLSPSLSPGKSWEGTAANLAGAMLVGAAISPWAGGGLLYGAGLGAVVSIAGQFGDLLESAFKRSAGVKDSGDLLPGHGGMLDRIDALILAAPAGWCYLRLSLL